MQLKTLQIPWTTIGIDATTEVFIPCTNWVLRGGFFVKKTTSGLTFGRVTGQIELKGC